jgi:hypothetical protein
VYVIKALLEEDVPHRPQHFPAGGRPAGQSRLRHRLPQLRDVQQLLQQTLAQLDLEKDRRQVDGSDAETAEYIGVPVEGPYKPDHYRY